MEISLYTICSFNKTKDLAVHQLKDEVLDAIDEEKNCKHILVPSSVNIEEYKELFATMHGIVTRYVKAYKDDFYRFDLVDYFKYSEEVIWIVRPSGTTMINCNFFDSEGEKRNAEDVLTYYMKEKDRNIYYLIKDGSIRKVTGEKAHEHFKRAKIKLSLS